MPYVAASGFPTRFFPNINYTTIGGSGGFFIPYANLESYAASTSGQIAELTYSVLDKVASGITVLATGDRPTNFTISRSTVSTGDNAVQRTYTVTFNLNASNTVYDVKDE